jgi:hypothetical protein
MTTARRSDAAAPAGGSTTPPASPDQLLTAPQLEYSETALDERIAEMKTAMESEMKSRSQHPRGYVHPAARDLLRAVNAWLGR